ncbi:hypothetical protein B0H14DRAFT_3463808 [Mycena olivaceomarginata]|nr:hypothetical protein B0H14DRAFT_3463808 [Mycena olivaceomarginata]
MVRPQFDPIILRTHSDEHSSSFRYDTAKTWIIDAEEVEDDSEADEQDQLDEY